MLTPEQMMAAQKANMDTLLSLTHKAFEGVERLVELNMQIARAAMTDSADTAKAALSVKDAQELLALQTSLLQPTAEKAAAYQRSLYELAQRTNAEWIQVAEAQMAKAQKDLNTMIDTATKGAPAGTESAVALVRSAVSAANTAFDQVSRATKQVVEMAEANVAAASKSATARTAKKAA